MPDDLAGLGPQREHRGYPQIVTRPPVGIPRPAVARSPVSQVEIGIVGTRYPRGAASAKVGITGGPGLVTFFTGTRGGVSAPQLAARHGMVSRQETTNAVFAAGHARDQHAVHHRGRRGDRIAFLPFGDLGLPDFLAGFRIERLQVRVDRGDEYLAVVERNPSVGEPAAHHARGRRVPLDGRCPDLPAGGDIDCHRLPDVAHVHDAVVDERLPLLADLVRE